MQIHTDKTLMQLLRENGNCFVDPEGAICTSTPLSPELTVIKDYISSKPGKKFGITPVVKQVAQDLIDSRLAEMGNQAASLDMKRDSGQVAARFEKLLETALNRGVSDLHIEVDLHKTLFSCRIDGAFAEFQHDQDASYGRELFSYIFLRKGKASSWSMKTENNVSFTVRLTKDGDLEREYEWRVSQLPTREGAKITIRAIDSGTNNESLTFEKLGLSPGHCKHLERVINETQGLILISGPTGSGKTTLINSTLRTVPETKLIHTLEDPPEGKLTRRNELQTPVNSSVKRDNGEDGYKDFAYYGKLILRNDTDLVFFGEIRDKEAAQVAVRMAETGQTCIATIHCNSAVTSISTLITQMEVNPALLAAPGIVKALGHQRLVKRICPHCSISHSDALAHSNPMVKGAASDVEIEIDRHVIDSKQDIVRSQVRHKNPEGCKFCTSGEKGRTAIFELVLLDDLARNFISKMDISGWEHHLKSSGWPSIRDHGRAKVFTGECDYQSVMAQVDGSQVISIDELHNGMHLEYA